MLKIKQDFSMIISASILALASFSLLQQTASHSQTTLSNKNQTPQILLSKLERPYIPVIMRQESTFNNDLQEFSRVMARMNNAVTTRAKLNLIETSANSSTQQVEKQNKPDVSQFATSIIKDVIREEVQDFIFKVRLVGRVGEFASGYVSQE